MTDAAVTGLLSCSRRAAPSSTPALAENRFDLEVVFALAFALLLATPKCVFDASSRIGEENQ
jgi:hypothetical protein